MMRRARTEDAKDERRQTLLNAALDEFFERGFSAARLDDIAKRANLSKGTIYLYFESKKALFQALIETLATPKLEHIEAMMSTSFSLREAIERLANFAPLMIRESEMPKLMKVLAGDSHGFPDIVQNYRREVLEKMLEIVSRIVKRAIESGEIDTPDAKLMTRLIIAPIAMSGMWQAMFGADPEAEVDLETLFRMHADNLLKLLNPVSQPAEPA